jgi:hypothetical protein
MYDAHPSISTPPDETVVWRYMNLEKLLGLLCERSLFLCRLDGFRDPWEGRWPKSAMDSARANWGKLAEDFLSLSKWLRTALFVNCWHANEHESAALWEIYSGNAGLAIKSTCGRLKSAIKTDKTFFLGEVNYCDYSHCDIPVSSNMLTFAFLKRKSFEHEREVRVLICDFPDDGSKVDCSKAPEAAENVWLPVDVQAMIETLYISPTAPPWYLPYVCELLTNFGLPGIRVENSQLYSNNVY